MTTSHLIPGRTTPVNPTPRRSYPQDWPSYNKAQTSEKDTLQTLLADLCAQVPQPPHLNGRPPLPLSDMVFASALKVYSGFSARRFSCDVEDAREMRTYLDCALLQLRPTIYPEPGHHSDHYRPYRAQLRSACYRRNRVRGRRYRICDFPIRPMARSQVGQGNV